MNDYVIGITGINASDNPAPGIGVAKSLKQATGLDVKVVGLAYDALEPGIYMDWFIDRAYIIPYPTAGHQPLVERLGYIKDQCGLDLVIPTLDSELPFYIQAREQLEQLGIKTFMPTGKQLNLRDKQSLEEVAKAAGIEAPAQRVINSIQELYEAAAEFGYPLMIKGSIYTAHKAYCLQEAIAGFSNVVAQRGYPVIVQQMVSGEEMNVIGLGDGQGEVLGLVAIKKMSTTGLGKIWSGVTIDHPELIDATRQFVAASQWQGAFEMECMVDGDRVYLIEVNPRFPAWVYFATGVGVNLPEMLVHQAMGQAMERKTAYMAGQFYMRYTDERVCDMAQFQQMVTQGESK